MSNTIELIPTSKDFGDGISIVGSLPDMLEEMPLLTALTILDTAQTHTIVGQMEAADMARTTTAITALSETAQTLHAAYEERESEKVMIKAGSDVAFYISDMLSTLHKYRKVLYPIGRDPNTDHHIEGLVQAGAVVDVTFKWQYTYGGELVQVTSIGSDTYSTLAIATMSGDEGELVPSEES